MNSNERMLAFFSTMFITFGISGLDFEYPAFDENTKEYICLTVGVIGAIAFLFLKFRK